LLNLPQDRPTRKEARRYWEMGLDPDLARFMRALR
jgi:hypothetical protein